MDWLTGIITILAMELIARKRWYGWLIGLCNQALWGYLILDRRLWGLAPLCAILAWRYAAAMWRWRKAV